MFDIGKNSMLLERLIYAAYEPVDFSRITKVFSTPSMVIYIVKAHNLHSIKL